MGNGKESDRADDKVQVKPEKGTEAEQKTAADSQGEAAKLARLEGMTKALNFDKGNTMRGLLLRQDGGGAKFEITGLEKDTTGAEAQQIKDKVQATEKGRGDATYCEVAPEGPTTISRPDGSATEITYGTDGKATKIDFGNKTEMVKNGDGTWTYTDANGETSTYEMDISVSADGKIIQTTDDGATRTINPDKSQVDTNAEGQVVEIKRADGDKLKITNSPPPPEGDGKPTEIIDEKDGTRTYRDGDTWKVEDKDGNTHEFPNTEITVDADGNIKRENNADGTITTYGIDGSKETMDLSTGMVDRENADGSKEVYDGSSGARESYTSDQGREFKETDQGLEYTVKPGDNPWNIVKDSLKAGGNPDPSNAEIAAELKRIEKATGKDMNDTIYAGDKFVIPPKGDATAAPTEKPEAPAEKPEPPPEKPARPTDKGEAPEPPEQPDETPPEQPAETPESGKPKVVPIDQAVPESEMANNTVVMDKDGPVVVKDAQGNLRYIDYDSEGHQKEIIDEDGTHLVREQEEDGSFKWHRYDADGTTPVVDADGKPVTYDKVEVNGDGVLTTKETGSNMTVSEYPNGNTVRATNIETSITNANGDVMTYKHTPDGHVTEITSSTEPPIKYNEKDGTYVFYDEGGKPITEGVLGPQKMEVTIDESGNITMTRPDASTTISRPDGTVEDWTKAAPPEDAGTKPTDTPTDKTGTTPEKPDETPEKPEAAPKHEVKKDEEGRVTDVTYDDGESRRFSYKDGQLDEMTEKDGTIWQKEADGWHHYAKDEGKLKPVVDEDGRPEVYNDIKVDENGNVTIDTEKTNTFESPDGYKQTQYKNDPSIEYTDENSDGSISTFYKDGSWVTQQADGSRTIWDKGVTTKVDKDDKITERSVTYPDGTTRSFGYDSEGNVNQITHPDGSSWTKDPSSNTWTKDGSAETWTGAVKTDADGNFMYYDEVTGKGEKVDAAGKTEDLQVAPGKDQPAE